LKKFGTLGTTSISTRCCRAGVIADLRVDKGKIATLPTQQAALAKVCTPGHEMSEIITEFREGVAGFAIGDRVVIEMFGRSSLTPGCEARAAYKIA
jgi:D-arabinose 1-dehydrogenase-like Zn-dependent alcohol dehydrogenase